MTEEQYQAAQELKQSIQRFKEFLTKPIGEEEPEILEPEQ